MYKLPMLIRREFWEHRNTFVTLPLVIAGFMMLLMLAAATLSGSDFIDVDVEFEQRSSHQVHRLETDNVFSYMLHELDGQTDRRKGKSISSALHGMASPLLVTMWFVIFFYLLDALYSDRKDRSILFWKSLPVSDAMTVLSKLITALVAVPLVYFAVIALLHLVSMIFLTIATFGTEYSAWEMIWAPAPLFSTWGLYLMLLVFYGFWALPFFAWLLAVSSYVKSAPLMWVVGIPVAIVILEKMFSDESRIADWIALHLVPVTYMIDEYSVTEYVLEQIATLQMLSAIVVGAALLFAAVWLRGKADEI